MVERIATAKVLGFRLFEVDVMPVRVQQPEKATADGALRYTVWFGTPQVIEGDEWKQTDDAQKKYMASHVITVYALVVE
jgi:hypothetical protein